MRWRRGGGGGGGSLVTINEVFLILRLPFKYFSFVGLASFVRLLRCYQNRQKETKPTRETSGNSREIGSLTKVTQLHKRPNVEAFPYF